MQLYVRREQRRPHPDGVLLDLKIGKIFSDHDYEGTARPKGGVPDIGAFEQ